MHYPSSHLDPFVKAYRFMSQFVDRRNFHEGIYRDNQKNWYPKSTIQQLIQFQFTPKYKYKHITRQQMLQHFNWDIHLGFTNQPNNTHYLLCIDLDFYSLTDEIASIGKKLIEDLLKQPIYWELSTNKQGLHGYIILHKNKLHPQYIRDSSQKIQSILSIRSKQVGMKCIDVTGLPAIYHYESKRLVDVTGSTPAKLPRDYHRIEELMNHKVVEWSTWDNIYQTHHELLELVSTTGGEVYCLTKMESSTQLQPLDRVMLRRMVEELWCKSCEGEEVEYVKGRYLTKEDFVSYALTWICAVHTSDKKEGPSRGTCAVKGLEVYYNTITTSKFAYRALKWVGEYLESIGVLICVNRGYIVGLMARRWKIRIKSLDEALKSKSFVGFRTNFNIAR